MHSYERRQCGSKYEFDLSHDTTRNSPVISNYTIDLSSDAMQKLGPWEDEDQKNMTVSPYTTTIKSRSFPAQPDHNVLTTFDSNSNTGYTAHFFAQY